MPNGTPLDSETLRKIPELRKQGLSFYKIADILGIGESTARKHQNYRATTAKPLDQYNFTVRQMEIALEAAKKNARK